MSNALITRLQKQRELKVVVGKFTFTARRPTDVEMIEIGRSGVEWHGMAERFVTGWEGVSEDDIIGGGGSDKPAFTLALWAEWCADRPDFWEPIASALLDAYKAHAAHLKDTAGK
jgi:hypothetical protein